MNIYKAPNLIISPKRKAYRRGGGGARVLNDESIYTHTHTHSLFPSITVSGREGYWDGKRCVFRADLKADVELE